MNEATHHHPTLYATGRQGCWATCACGWKSATYRTTTGAHLAFGEHLTNDDLRAALDQGEAS